MTYLRHIRDQRGLSQDKLSELSGVPQNTISLVERGVRTPHNGTLSKLAQVLQVANPSMLVMPMAPITTFGELIAGTPDKRRGYLEFLRMQGTLDGFVRRLEDTFEKSVENGEDGEWARLQVAFLFGYARGAQEEASKDKQS